MVVRSASSLDVNLMEARAHLLDPLRPQLHFSGWEAEELSAAARAAGSAEKVMALDDAKLSSIAEKLASQGAALQPGIPDEREAVAVAFFERQYARLLTELIMQATDFWGVGSAVEAYRCASPLATRVLTQERVSELVEAGLTVIDDALGETEVRAARAALERAHAAGELRSDEFQSTTNIRNDQVGWLDHSRDALAATPALAPVIEMLRGLPAEVERGAAGWRLTVPALLQAALYDGAAGRPAFYHKHLDCADPSTNPRRLTAILYLNPGWDASRYGGGLRARLPRGGGDIEVAPVGGRLVVFSSAEVAHEVLPSTAPRMAVTLWAFEESFSAPPRAR